MTICLAVPRNASPAPARRRRVRQVDDCETDAHTSRERLLRQGAPGENRGY